MLPTFAPFLSLLVPPGLPLGNLLFAKPEPSSAHKSLPLLNKVEILPGQCSSTSPRDPLGRIHIGRCKWRLLSEDKPFRKGVQFLCRGVLKARYEGETTEV
jgi:hypothetical protein